MKIRTCLLASVLSIGALGVASPSTIAGETDRSEWKPILDARLRFETVEQAGFARDAHGFTLRVRAGVQSPIYRNFQALVELEAVAAPLEDYSSTNNGKTIYPVIADPDTIELNRAQIAYTGFENATITLGRQRITLNNQRFLGNVGFRQNEQTYDALRLETSIDAVKLGYAYIEAVQRIFGNEASSTGAFVGQFESDSHVANAELKTERFGTFAAYALLLDLDEAPVLSTASYGLRWTSAFALGEDTKLTLSAEGAAQSDYADNPRDIDLGYLAAQADLKVGAVTAQLGAEQLGGDGTTGFSTPLATLFKFNGWADVFLNTPANGLTDIYGGLSVNLKEIWADAPLTVSLVYHDYQDDSGDLDYGSEVDFVITAKLDDNWTAEARIASYDGGDDGFAGRDKVWFTLEYAL